MGRPKKSALASRNNGARATNKGMAKNVKKELFGGYSPRGSYMGSYVIKTVAVRREMSKGEVRRREQGCEHDVFTFCMYHGKFLRFDKDDEGSGKGKQSVTSTGVDLQRWQDASERATKMLEECADDDPRSKMARLRKRTKGATAKIRFAR